VPILPHQLGCNAQSVCNAKSELSLQLKTLSSNNAICA
jgi:hypothetical protein